MGIKVKRNIYFLSHCNPNKGKINTLFSFLFFFSPYFQTCTRELISFFFILIFLLLFVSFSCLVFPLFSLVFLKKIIFLTLVNVNNTSFFTHKSSIFMYQLVIEFNHSFKNYYGKRMEKMTYY